MLMRRIDELFTARPFLGSRRLMVLLRAEEYSIGIVNLSGQVSRIQAMAVCIGNL